MTRRYLGRAVVALGAALAVGVPAGADDLSDRIDRMERELQEMKRELQRRKTGTEAPPTPAAPSTAEAPPPAAPPPAVAAAPPKGGAVQDAERVVDAIASRVNIGAYSSMRYEASNLDEAHSTFTFRRFVLTADANIAPRLKAAMELEFERFRKLELEKATEPAEGGLKVEQTVEGTNDSEIALEQAWLQYDFTDWIGLRAGGVLVPLGRFNLNHDDNEWDLPRRSLVDRGSPVLPSTAAWSELGAGFLGTVPVGEKSSLDYQVYVVNGVALDVEFEQIVQTRSPEPAKQVIEVEVEPSTGTFSSDVKEGKAVTGRLAFSPALGHEVAGSWYWGQYTPDFLDHEDLYSLGFDGKTGIGPFEFEGQYVFTHFDGIEWTPWTAGFIDIEESHTSLGALALFRSPRHDRSWITAAGAVLDAAALASSTLDLPRQSPAELCLRAGYLSLRSVADFFRLPYDPDPAPGDPIAITRDEYDAAVSQLEAAGVPLRSDRDQAWRDFAGWRVNYDEVLLQLAAYVVAPYAPWSSDRSPTHHRPPVHRRR